MTTNEIGERLKAAFPGCLVSFGVEVEVSVDGEIETKIHVYHGDCSYLVCSNLEHGILRVQQRLERASATLPAKPFTIELDN